MAKITEVSVSYGLTKNLGNYESLRIDITLAAKVGNGEDVNEIWQQLFNDAKIKANEAAKREQDTLDNW